MPDSVAGLSGTCLGTCPTPVPGHHGQGYLFNGTTDCIDIPDCPELDPVHFTVAVWATQAHDGATAPALTQIAKQIGTGTNDSWELEAGPNFSEAFFTSDNTSFPMLYSPAHVVVADRWYHLAGSWDGTTQRIYIDGILAGESVSGRSGRVRCLGRAHRLRLRQRRAQPVLRRRPRRD